METRETKGLVIAANVQPHRNPNVWIVPSQSSSKTYTVDLSGNTPTCTCPDYAERLQECKHIFAAKYAVMLERGEALPDVEQVAKPTYSQQWHEYNLAQTNEKAHFLTLLHELCQGVEEPVQTLGRPRAPYSDIIFAACLKVYCGMSGRRNQTDMHDALQRGHLQRRVHYNTISKYLETPELTPYLKQLIIESSLPLKSVECDFAVDSSGFSTGQFMRWFNAKWLCP